MFTEQDAINRLLVARTGSLDPDNINRKYLNALRLHVQRWLDYIDDTINDLNIKELQDQNSENPQD